MGYTCATFGAIGLEEFFGDVNFRIVTFWIFPYSKLGKADIRSSESALKFGKADILSSESGLELGKTDILSSECALEDGKAEFLSCESSLEHLGRGGRSRLSWLG